MSLPTASSSNSSTGGPAMPDPRDPRTTEMIDAPMMALANWSGGDHRKFLYAFFSFLHRRTDFYLVPHPDDVNKDGVKTSKMGFAEGDAEKLLLAAFRQFPLRRMPKQKEEAATEEEDNSKPAAANSVAKPSPSPTPDRDLLDPMHGVKYNDEKKQIPVGNGGATPLFRWTQNLEECTVLLPLPAGLSRAKDISVELRARSVDVKAKAPLNGESESRVLLQGQLTQSIKPSESTWSIESGMLTIILYKQQQSFWKAILQGDEEIDTTQVDSRRHIQDYDESTQAQIRNILHQQSAMRKAEVVIDTSNPDTFPAAADLPDGVEYLDMPKLNLN
jgi:hypothetical protein